MNAWTILLTFFSVAALLIEIQGLRKTSTKRPFTGHEACWVSPWGWIRAGASVTVVDCRQATCTSEHGLRYTSCPDNSSKRCRGKKDPIPEDHLYKAGYPKCCPLRECRSNKKDSKYKIVFENM